MDFDFVTARVATGGSINAALDVEALVKAGVTHVIDCQAEHDDAPTLSGRPDIVGYCYNGVNDDGVSKPDSWFERSINFALAALSKPHTKVYAHCAAGVNRGPSTAYAILLALGFPADVAEHQIRSNRPQVGIAYKHDAERAAKALGYL